MSSQPMEESRDSLAGSNNRQFACSVSRWRPRPLFKAVTTITVMFEVERVNATESPCKISLLVHTKPRPLAGISRVAVGIYDVQI